MVQLEKNQALRDLLLAQQTHAKAAEDTEVLEYSTEEGVSADEDLESRSSSLERTTSQAAAQAQIQGVLQRLHMRKGAVQELQQSVAAFTSSGDLKALQESEKALGTSQKQARNLGEDLLEDLLALDRLSGLIDEDRSNRKAAISCIEELLEKVDASKSRLAGLRKDVQTALEAESKRQQEIEKREETNDDLEEETLPSRKPQNSKVSPDVSHALPTQHVASDQPRLKGPDRAMWKKVSRPVDFQTRQERGGYAILAAVPCLNTQDLDIRLSDDKSTLTIEGVCEPTPRQAEHMRQQFAVEVQRVARTSPQRFRQLCSNLDNVAAQTYAEVGEGRFGKFSETFELPKEVDTQRIKASFDDGVLRLTLPRRVRRETHPMTARHPFGHQSHARLFGHPGFGW